MNRRVTGPEKRDQKAIHRTARRALYFWQPNRLSCILGKNEPTEIS